MKTTKYIYRTVGKHIFRVRMDMFKDSSFGILIRYEIQKPPRNWWERLKQLLTMDCYYYSYWSPFLTEKSLEECITYDTNEVAQKLDMQEAPEKEWENM